MASLQSTRKAVFGAVMMLAVALAPVLGAAGPASAQAAPNLIVNPSFETPDIGAGFVSLTGNTLPGWVIVGTVDLLHGLASDGDQSIELPGDSFTPESPPTSPRGVEQTFNTVAGTTYTVSYDVAPRAPGDVQVFVNGTLVDSHVFTTAGTTFQTRSFSFTATGPQTTLRIITTSVIENAQGDTPGVALDNVRVTAVTPGCDAPKFFLLANNQLYSGVMQPNGFIVYTLVGPVPAGTNGLAFNPIDGYLYANQGGVLLRIDPNTGAVIPLGPTTPSIAGSISGTIDPDGNYLAVVGDQLVKINPTTLTGSSVPLSQPVALADIAFGPDGFLWSATTAGLVRINPNTGQVTVFPLPQGMGGTGPFGGAFAVNGGVAFVQNNPFNIFFVRIINGGSATPTIFLAGTQVQQPVASANPLDAASCVPPANAICLAPPPASLPGYNVIRVTPGMDTVGTPGNDLIIGSSGNDRIAALGGDDIIFGMGGDDQISAGDGNDTVCAGTGNDWVSGGAGNDILSGDEGNDDLSGGAGDDQLFGGPGADRFATDPGTDACYGGGNVGDIAATSCDIVYGMGGATPQ